MFSKDIGDPELAWMTAIHGSGEVTSALRFSNSTTAFKNYALYCVRDDTTGRRYHSNAAGERAQCEVKQEADECHEEAEYREQDAEVYLLPRIRWKCLSRRRIDKRTRA